MLVKSFPELSHYFKDSSEAKPIDEVLLKSE
jgi:hypothetical protein